MAKWSKAAKRAVRKYNAYKRKAKDMGRKYGMKINTVPYQVFMIEYNKQREEVERGERKSVGDIIGMMVSDQVYQISGKQFSETIRAIEEWNASHPDQQIDLGEAANKNSLFYQMKMRTETFEDSEWFDLIRARRDQLFAEGKSKKEVAREISRTFYGSK